MVTLDVYVRTILSPKMANVQSAILMKIVVKIQLVLNVLMTRDVSVKTQNQYIQTAKTYALIKILTVFVNTIHVLRKKSV
jgi:hypothetical protein